jgi:hypothetical protein
MSSPEARYPLSEAILAIKNLPLQPMYSVPCVARIFGVSAGAIQSRMSSGRFPAATCLNEGTVTSSLSPG